MLRIFSSPSSFEFQTRQRIVVWGGWIWWMLLGIYGLGAEELAPAPVVNPPAPIATEASRTPFKLIRLAKEDASLPPHAVACLGARQFRLGIFARVLAWTPDGKQAVCTSGATAVTWIDLDRGVCTRRIASGRLLIGHVLATDPNGGWVAMPGPDEKRWLQVVRVKDGEPIASIARPPAVGESYHSLVLSPDGRWLLAGKSHLFYPIDTASWTIGKPVAEDEAGGIVDPIFSADSKDLVYPAYDRTEGRFSLVLRRISAADWKARGEVAAGDPAFRFGLQALRGQVFVCDNNDSRVRIVDCSTWNAVVCDSLKRFDIHHAVSDPANQRMALAASTEEKEQWNLVLASGDGLKVDRVVEFPGHNVEQMVFSPDNKSLAVVTREGGLFLIDPATGQLLHTLQLKSDKIGDVSFSPDCGRIISIEEAGELTIWNLATGTGRSASGNGSAMGHLQLSPDGEELLTGAIDSNQPMLRWDLRTRQVTGKVAVAPQEDMYGGRSYQCQTFFYGEGHRLLGQVGATREGSFTFHNLSGQDIPLMIAPAPAGDAKAAPVKWTRLASSVAFYDAPKQCLRVWDPATGRETAVIAGVKSIKGNLVAIPGEKPGLAAESEGKIMAWEVATGELLFSIDDLPIWNLRSVSPRGEWLILDLKYLSSMVWNRRTGKGDTSWIAPDQPKLSSFDQISPDERWLLARDADLNLVRIDLQQHRCTRLADATKNVFTRNWFSPDSRWLVFDANYGSLWVFDMAKGTCVKKIPWAHAGPVSEATFSKDGNTLYTAGTDGAILIWDFAALVADPDPKP